MSRPYRILVTGSRHWTDHRAVIAEFRALFRMLDHRSEWVHDYVLVHGAADGLDILAAAVADEITRTLRIPIAIEPHPADWTTHGKGAGPIRNQAMVDLGADICLAFPTASSVGTWDCVRRANRAGIRVIVVPERTP